jgi:hypothetical protein
VAVVSVRHHDAALLQQAVVLYTDVCRGHWEAVAELCAADLGDPDGAASDLQDLAQRHPVPAGGIPVISIELVADDEIRLHGGRAAVMQALDLFSRVQCGQWHEASDTALGGWPHSVGDELQDIRVRHQAPEAFGARNPRASIGIGGAPAGAKLAYHVWKQLGDGTAAKPTFSIGPLEVLVVTNESDSQDAAARPSAASSSSDVQWRIQTGAHVEGTGIVWLDVTTPSPDKSEALAQLEWRRRMLPAMFRSDSCAGPPRPPTPATATSCTERSRSRTASRTSDAVAPLGAVREAPPQLDPALPCSCPLDRQRPLASTRMGHITGVLIAESLKPGADLADTSLRLDRVQRVNATDATADQPSVWTLLYVRADQADAESLTGKLAELLDAPGWYADFHTDEETWVVFPGKVFRYGRGDSEGRAAAAAYGSSIGVPASQLDWEA